MLTSPCPLVYYYFANSARTLLQSRSTTNSVRIIHMAMEYLQVSK